MTSESMKSFDRLIVVENERNNSFSLNEIEEKIDHQRPILIIVFVHLNRFALIWFASTGKEEKRKKSAQSSYHH